MQSSAVCMGNSHWSKSKSLQQQINVPNELFFPDTNVSFHASHAGTGPIFCSFPCSRVLFVANKALQGLTAHDTALSPLQSSCYDDTWYYWVNMHMYFQGKLISSSYRCKPKHAQASCKGPWAKCHTQFNLRSRKVHINAQKGSHTKEKTHFSNAVHALLINCSITLTMTVKKGTLKFIQSIVKQNVRAEVHSCLVAQVRWLMQ